MFAAVTRPFWKQAFLLLMGSLAMPCGANAADTRPLISESDLGFVHRAALDVNLDIQMSRIATLRANSDEVRQLASALAEDNSRARRKLKELALWKNVELKDDLDIPSARRLLAMQRYTGDEFDRQYLTYEVDQYRRALSFYQDSAEKNVADDLRAYAGSRLGTLEAHLKLLQALADSR